MANTKKTDSLQKKMGYQFNNIELLNNALTHSSYANEKHWAYERNNERIEFLGDAVLELISTEYLYASHPKMTEGELTRFRASLVCEMSLASSARELGLGDCLFLGKGEYQTGGNKRDSILSDAFEAVIGAIYLDGGLEPAKKFVHQYVLSDIEQKQLFHDSKTILQEMVQSHFHEGTKICYPLIKESGPDHHKTFFVVCEVNGVEYGSGSGRTKKAAEQKAAYETIIKLRQEKNGCI